MLDAHIIWDLADDPKGNVAHIAEHGIVQEDAEHVLFDPESDTRVSRSTGRSITFGYTSSGQYVAVVWEHVMDDPLTIRPVTAYEVPEPRPK